jgi:hypothetical protein
MTLPVSYQNDLVFNLTLPAIFGLQISAASTTVVAVAPGGARDSNNNMTMVVGLSNPFGQVLPNTQFLNYQPGLLINSAVNGANGLDTGTIAASTQYAIYLIGDSRNYNPTAAVLSLTSNVAPVLPSGYDSYRLIGFWATDGSSHFVYTNVKPQNIAGLLTYFNVPPLSVLSGGTATSFTAMDLTTNAAVPTTTLQNILVTMLCTFTPVAAGDLAQFRPTGSSATTNLPTITGLVAGVAQTQYIQMIAGVGSSKPEIDYKLTSGSDALSVSVVEWAGVSNSAYPALV